MGEITFLLWIRHVDETVWILITRSQLISVDTVLKNGRSFKLHKNLSDRCKTKKILLLGTIFMHVALLLTEMS